MNIYHLFKANDKKEFTHEILQSIAEFDRVKVENCKKFYESISDSFNYTGFQPFQRWKQSNYSDLSIYNMPYYKVDTLVCYNKCSIKTTDRVIETLACASACVKHKKSIIDYGGGLGATTLQLAVNFPKLQVYYCDLQNDFFRFLLKKYDIKLKNLQIVDKIKSVDVLLMLEFLEHFKEPIAFLQSTLEKIDARFVMFSYTFRKLGLGHFPSYLYNGREYYRKVFAKVFDREMQKRHKLIDTNKNVFLYKVKP